MIRSTMSEFSEGISISNGRGAVLTLNPATGAIEVSRGHTVSSLANPSISRQPSTRRTSKGVRNGALAGGSSSRLRDIPALPHH